MVEVRKQRFFLEARDRCGVRFNSLGRCVLSVRRAPDYRFTRSGAEYIGTSMCKPFLPSYPLRFASKFEQVNLELLSIVVAVAVSKLSMCGSDPAFRSLLVPLSCGLPSIEHSHNVSRRFRKRFE